MADETTAAFAIDLKDGVSGPALDAQKAISRLRDDVNKDTRALAEMQKAMKRLQGGTVVNVEQFKKLNAQISAKKQAVAEAQGALVDLGGALDSVKRPSTGFSAMMERLQEQTKGAGGPVEGLVKKLTGLKVLFTKNGVMVLGAIAFAAALAVVTYVALSATKATLAYGIAQADAHRSELLRLEGLTKMEGLAAGNAREVQDAINRVSGATALGREEIGKYSASLYRAGLRGEDLSQALEAVAITAATQGDAAAGATGRLASSIAAAGGSVKKLADTVKARLGGIAAKQMLALDVQSEKLRENFSLLFADLKIDGLLGALKSVGDLFSQSTVSGRALKTLAQTIFNPMIGAIEYLAPLAKRFFQGFIIGAQDITIAVLKTAIWVKKTFGIQFKDSIGESKTALSLGKTAVYLFAGALAFATVAAGLLGVALLPVLWGGVAAAWSLVAAGAALAAPFLGFAALFAVVFGATYALVKYLKDVDWKALGSSICTGIVSGLKAGAKWIVDAMTWLADKTWGAFKKKLGIASPSKVFAELGVELPAGVEQGIERGQPDLDRAVDAMVQPPAAPGGSATLARAGDRSVSLTIEHLTIQTQASDAQGIVRDIGREFEALLSRLVVQTGVAT